MKQATIMLYQFAELSEAAQETALIEHANFLVSTPVLNENENGQIVEEYQKEWSRADVKESIEINEYYFFSDGSLAHVIHYTGNHSRAGEEEFIFKGTTYKI